MADETFGLTFFFGDAAMAKESYVALVHHLKDRLVHEERARAGSRRESVTLVLEFPGGERRDFNLSWGGRDRYALYENGNWAYQVFSLSQEAEANERCWFDFSIELWKIATPYIGYTDIEMVEGFNNRVCVVGEGRERRFDPTVATIRAFNMANLFSKEFVERFGRERLIAARERAFRVEEIDDGSILIVPQALVAKGRDRRLFDPLYLLGLPPPGAEGADAATYRALLDYFERKKSEDPDGLARELGVDEAAMEAWRRFLSRVSVHTGTDLSSAPHRALSEAPWPEFAMSVAIEVGRGTLDFDPDDEEDLEEVLRGFGEKIQKALRGGG